MSVKLKVYFNFKSVINTTYFEPACIMKTTH